ncbi:hypothetical protein HOY82DRAFT_560843 [Tuber indicum]|nr:hypothetical protein HOY82DRAFT_560843 [Tuber indicum]
MSPLLLSLTCIPTVQEVRSEMYTRMKVVAEGGLSSGSSINRKPSRPAYRYSTTFGSTSSFLFIHRHRIGISAVPGG